MSVEAFAKSRKAAEEVGLYARSFWWNTADYLRIQKKVCAMIEADSTYAARAMVGFDDEKNQVTLWTYVADAEGKVVYAENISFPCPPWYPPTGPPCP